MINRVILVGRLATDPQQSYTPSGIAVTQFRIAVDRPLSAEARQAGQEKTADFIDIVCWRQNAEFAAQYLAKGRLVGVDGRLQIREYQTQDGQRRRVAEVVADSIKGLDRPRDGDGEGGYAGGGYDQAPAAPARSGGYSGGGAARTSGGGYSGARGGGRDANQDYDEMGDLADPFAE